MTKEDLEIIQIEIDKAIAELYDRLTHYIVVNLKTTSGEYAKTSRREEYELLTSGDWRKERG